MPRVGSRGLRARGSWFSSPNRPPEQSAALLQLVSTERCARPWQAHVNQANDRACLPEASHRRSRIFIVGLSAGGAMAPGPRRPTTPETFAGAAFVAAMPVSSVRDAICHGRNEQWSSTAFVGMGEPRRGTGHSRPQEILPADQYLAGVRTICVNPKNADAMLRQWLQAGDIGDQHRTSKEKEIMGHAPNVKLPGQEPSFYSIDGIGHGLLVKAHRPEPHGGSRRSLRLGGGSVGSAGVDAAVETLSDTTAGQAIAPGLGGFTSQVRTPRG